MKKISESYQFQNVEIPLNALMIKLINEHSFEDIIEQMRILTVDYHSGYRSWINHSETEKREISVEMVDAYFERIITLLKSFKS